MSYNSQIYEGSVMHRRLAPRVHHFRYDVFWLLLDLDEIEKLAKELRWFSYNRFNLFSFHDRDHGDGSEVPVREQIRSKLAKSGIEAEKILLFCMPRTLGYAFNPLSIFFCYGADGKLIAIVHEVHNTSGERHSYVFPVEENARTLRQSCRKEFYVSPFLDMDLRYDFRIVGPDERIAVAITASDRSGPMLCAALAGERHALSDRALWRAFLRIPFVTLKVIGAIHWQALKLWRKNIAIRPRPASPGTELDKRRNVPDQDFGGAVDSRITNSCG